MQRSRWAILWAVVLIMGGGLLLAQNLKLLGVTTARELAEIIVAVGLAQNLAAIRALATEGIQRGHMTLHARQVAIAAGATGEQIERVAAQLVAERKVRLDRAQEIVGAQAA